MTERAPRDFQGEQDHAEWVGWAKANGYDNEYARDNGYEDMREAFTAGMQAARDLLLNVSKTLGETADGDVFYLATNPAEVFLRDGRLDQYAFIGLPDDVWHPVEDIGDPGQMVIVLHNVVSGNVPAVR